jgi:hypothetical protein
VTRIDEVSLLLLDSQPTRALPLDARNFSGSSAGPFEERRKSVYKCVTIFRTYIRPLTRSCDRRNLTRK